MKKVLRIFLLLSIFTLVGCGKTNNNLNDNNKVMREASKEYLKNTDDDKYFKPATDDYIFVIEKDTGIIEIRMLAFDEYGKLVQDIHRKEYLDGYGTYENYTNPNYEYNISSDKKVLYMNKMNEYDTNKEYYTLDKFRYIYKYIGEANNDDNIKLYMSKGLETKDTKMYKDDENQSAIQQLKSIASINGSDYVIEVKKNKIEESTHYTTLISGKNVLWYDAFSYYYAMIYNFDNNGNITNYYIAYVFDNASMINEYKMYQRSKTTTDSIYLDEEGWNSTCKQNKCNIRNNIYYTDNSNQIDKTMKKWSSLINTTDDYYTYFSDSKLSESQIQQLYKSK